MDIERMKKHVEKAVMIENDIYENVEEETFGHLKK